MLHNLIFPAYNTYLTVTISRKDQVMSEPEDHSKMGLVPIHTKSQGMWSTYYLEKKNPQHKSMDDFIVLLETYLSE